MNGDQGHKSGAGESIERDDQGLYGNGSLLKFLVLPSSKKYEESSWKITFNAILLPYIPTGLLIDIDNEGYIRGGKLWLSLQ